MQRGRNNWSVFFLFFLLSLLIFLFSKTHVVSGIGIIGNALFPVQALFYQAVAAPFSWHQDTKLLQLQNENVTLHVQLAHDQALKNDDAALRDQFQTTTPVSQSVLSAIIIGMPEFIPGVVFPENLIIDKGSDDGLHNKDTVIYKNMLVGQITMITLHAAQVTLLTNPQSSFTASSLTTNANGIIKGMGNGQMILDNVLLSDSLKTGDMVVTKGDQNIQQKGFPPGLIIGKISSVEKNPSSLFQRAKVQSLVDITKLHMVFVMRQ